MPNRILLPLIVACALFMQNLDSTVLSTALPAIADDFAVSPIQLKLALTSYFLSLAVFIPASGWLADRFGSRTIFMLAIFTFTLGSVFCGLSNSIGEIVVARIVQGGGGAMMVPVGRLVILRSVPKSELVGALAWMAVPALFGPVCGPPLGGFVTTYFSWRWIFWINVPIGVFGLFLAAMYIPNIFSERRNFDVLGFFLSGIGLAAFITASTSFGLDLLPRVYVWTLLIGGVVLLALYVAHSRRVANPILDLSLFRLPTFLHSIVSASLFRIGAGATPFLLPLLLQVGFGMSPFRSGLITFSSALGALFMKMLAPPVLRRFGFRNVLLANCAIAAAFVAAPSAFTATTPIALMLALLLAGGFFRSLQFTSTSALTFADVPRSMMSGATTISGVSQQLSLSLGVSVGATAVELTLHATGAALGAGAFWAAFLVVGAVSLSSLVPLAYLAPDAGNELSGRRSKDADRVALARTDSSG